MAIATYVLRRDWTLSARQALPIFKNLALIFGGSIILVYGMNAVMLPEGLFSGGLAGLAIILKNLFSGLNLGSIYMLLNIPLLVLGLLTISRRFVLYTLFGIISFSLAANIMHPNEIQLHDPLLAALLSGAICGIGSGLILRSLGSAGGMDILAIFLNKRFGVRVGTISFGSNALVLLAGCYLIDLNAALYSTILLFVSGQVINVVVSGFSSRMSVMVVSDRSEIIAREIIERLHGGVTFLEGEGAFSKSSKRVILTVTTLTELPKLKEMIVQQDANAFVVINNTLEVLGQRHGALKIY